MYQNLKCSAVPVFLPLASLGLFGWVLPLVNGFLLSLVPHTFPLHQPWMIQAPLCLLQTLIHFLSRLYLENLSSAPPTNRRPPAGLRLDFSSLQDEVPRWHFIFFFSFIYFIFTLASASPHPPPPRQSCPDAWLHEFWMWTDGPPCFPRWHFHTKKKNPTRKKKEEKLGEM